MKTDNLSRPGQAPQDGDTVKITHGNGAVEIKQHWTPKPPVVVPPEKSPAELAAAVLLANTNWAAKDQADALRLLLQKSFP